MWLFPCRRICRNPLMNFKINNSSLYVRVREILEDSENLNDNACRGLFTDLEYVTKSRVLFCLCFLFSSLQQDSRPQGGSQSSRIQRLSSTSSIILYIQNQIHILEQTKQNVNYSKKRKCETFFFRFIPLASGSLRAGRRAEYRSVQTLEHVMLNKELAPECHVVAHIKIEPPRLIHLYA